MSRHSRKLNAVKIAPLAYARSISGGIFRESRHPFASLARFRKCVALRGSCRWYLAENKPMGIPASAIGHLRVGLVPWTLSSILSTISLDVFRGGPACRGSTTARSHGEQGIVELAARLPPIIRPFCKPSTPRKRWGSAPDAGGRWPVHTGSVHAAPLRPIGPPARSPTPRLRLRADAPLGAESARVKVRPPPTGRLDRFRRRRPSFRTECHFACSGPTTPTRVRAKARKESTWSTPKLPHVRKPRRTLVYPA